VDDFTDEELEDAFTDAVKDGDDLSDDEDEDEEAVEAEIAEGDATGGAFSLFEERDLEEDGVDDKGRTTPRPWPLLASCGVEPADDLLEEADDETVLLSLDVRLSLLFADDCDDLLERVVEIFELTDEAVGGEGNGVFVTAVPSFSSSTVCFGNSEDSDGRPDETSTTLSVAEVDWLS
jgi:hypothetical protein